MTSSVLVNKRLIVGENISVLNVKISKNVKTSKAAERDIPKFLEDSNQERAADSTKNAPITTKSQSQMTSKMN